MEALTEVFTPLSDRLKNVSVSLTLKIVERAKALKAEGVDVISLSVGEPDHNTPEHVKRAGIAAIESNFTRYTAAAGILELRKAICEKLKRDNSLDYSPSQIVVSNGAKHAIANAIQAIVNPGDEVIIPEPCWLSYPDLVHLAGGIPVYVASRIEHGFHLQPDDLARVLTPKTKAIILNTPCNPTGAVLSRPEVEALCEVLYDHNVMIISDEIYEHLRFDGREHYSFAQVDGMKDRTVLVNGVSKCYAMTGWRIGYSASSDLLSDAMLRIQSQMTSSACSISQKAACEGIQGDQSSVPAMLKDFSRRRHICYDILSKCKGVKLSMPEGAFYIFPDVSAFYGKRIGDAVIKDSVDLAEHLITACHVAVVPGAAFRAPHCIRISYANSDEKVREGVNRICDFLNSLR
ncbi:pyridoxal phosphate-dependent aminotransferase [bacterium]|nr:pyridoxal phosphate-dependent aminotransferase [bacterium]